MFRSATIPTLFCTDARHAKHAAVSIVSLLENNPGAFFDLVVVSAGDLGSEAAKLRRTLAAYPNCALKTVRFDGRAGLLRLPAGLYYAVGDYMRLWMAEFFPASVAKVLCLGGDTIVTGDIGSLWRTELGEAVLGAVTIPDAGRGAALGIAEDYGYFDTGVMLVDLARWRRENLFARLLEAFAASDKHLEDDRDLLNLCLFDRRRVLPPTYNALSAFFSGAPGLGMSAADLAALRDAARVIRFDDALKPWSYLCRHPRRADYWHYLARTEWRDEEPEDRNLANWTKKTFGPLLPELLRGHWRGRASASVAAE